MEVLEVLCHMQEAGALVDTAEFDVVGADLRQRMAKVKEQTFHHVGRKINFSSQPQKVRYFYEELGLKPKSFTKKGAPQVSEEALRPYAAKYPAIRGFLEYSGLKKLQSTYVEGMQTWIDDDNRVRASFRQAGTVTGRFSCADPNLQNIPIREKNETDGKLIRNLFISPPGWSLVVSDYSMIELRIMAHYSQDKALLEACRGGHDLHSFTAARMFRVPIEKVGFEQRADGKKSNFALGYGGGPAVLMASGMTETQSKRNYDRWHQAYPSVKLWTRRAIRQVKAQGYATTILGRKRRLQDKLHHPVEAIRRRAERQAVNFIIQGSAADIMKLAMVSVYKAWEPWWDWRMTLTVHDELMHEVPDGEVEAALPLIRENMEGLTKGGKPLLSVPLATGIETAKRWGDAK
jgi:DNA polymerase-1